MKTQNVNAAEQEVARLSELQKEWSRTVASSRNDLTQNAARLLLPAINDLIDVTTARTIATYAQLPHLIFVLKEVRLLYPAPQRSQEPLLLTELSKMSHRQKQ
jgi:acyl-CoA reductase-like NAD-dependent aldehyde dehydrogenase